MNLEALKNELAKPEYTALSDQQAADALNATAATVPAEGRWATELTILNLLGLSDGEAALSALEQASTQQGGELLARAIRWIRSTQGIDLGNPYLHSQLLALAAANVITSDAASALIAYGSKTISKAQQLGITSEEIGVGYIINARRGMI